MCSERDRASRIWLDSKAISNSSIRYFVPTKETSSRINCLPSHSYRGNSNLDQKRSKQLPSFQSVNVYASDASVKRNFDLKVNIRRTYAPFSYETRTYVCILQSGSPRRTEKRNIEKKKKNTRTEKSNNPAADSDFHAFTEDLQIEK